MPQGITADIIQAANVAKTRAIAPYSNFRVGAAIQTEDGKIYSGCNIEASSYSLTLCAERVALFKALSEGEKRLKSIAIVTDTALFCPPCGACRQVLMDFAPRLRVILVNSTGESKSFQLNELLPEAFTEAFLERGRD